MTQDNPKISVIMSVYNGGAYLREAIESILNQTFTDFEFIIVNDGSTDNSLEIIQSYDDERIKIINNEKNIGLTKSLNKALKQARGEYIARQDADDISLPNRFEEQIKYLEKHPEVALLGTSKSIIDGNGKILRKVIALSNPSKNLFKGNAFTHGSVMFKKKVVDELGGYNELFRYAQDYELWLRIAKYYEVRNLTQALYKFRFHGESTRLKKGNESALYHIIALKSARDNLDTEVLRNIRDNGITSLYHYLNKEENVYFHKAVAYMHMRNNNIKAARREYKEAFKRDPINYRNTINIILSYLGEGIWAIIHKIYEVLHYLRQ